jgi:amidohydrolase
MPNMFLSLVVLQFAIAGPAIASTFDAKAVKAKADQVLARDYPALEDIYKDIHSHPELSYQEDRTASVLAREMRALGFEVTEHVGRTGIVAVYRNGEGPRVLIRTELDALPMEEKTGLPYASTAKQLWHDRETFVDHSCGHDIHMAAWVGTARTLLALKKEWRGTLMFVGQPAEEGGRGAKAMLDDGLFQRLGKPDYGFALHVGPDAYGEVRYRPGVLTSNSNAIEIRFNGRGTHGSMPNLGIDPVVIAAHFVVDLQSVVSREKNPADFGVISIGAIEGGSAGNIIPDHVIVRGTVRSYNEEVRQVLLDGIRRTAKAAADMANAPAPVISISEGANMVVNDASLTERTGRYFTAAFGDKAILEPSPSPASEDYSDFIAAGVPSVYFGIGGSDPAKVAQAKSSGVPLPANHSPFFAPVPEPSIRTGVEAMTIAVMSVLGR